jgi:hypothetical protein
MSEDSPIYNARTFTVTTGDGTVFECVAKMTGVRPTRAYWALTDPNGVTYVGPAYTGNESQALLEALVAQWWEAKKALGQAGVNAAAMLDALNDSDGPADSINKTPARD